MDDNKEEGGRLAQQPRKGRTRQIRRGKEQAKRAAPVPRAQGQEGVAAQPDAERRQVRKAKTRQVRANKQLRTITVSTARAADTLVAPIGKFDRARLSQLRQISTIRSTQRLVAPISRADAAQGIVVSRVPIGKVDAARTAQVRQQATVKLQSRLTSRPPQGS